MSPISTPRVLIAATAAIAVLFALLPVTAAAQSANEALSGPDATPNVLESDASTKPSLLGIDMQSGLDAWKAGVRKRTGLDFGVDYNLIGLLASESPGEDNSAASAMRFYGTWDLIDRDGPNTGSLVFKIEHRHGLTDVPPTEFGTEIGYAGLLTSVFSDQGWRATHLYWQQDFANGRRVAYAGWLDVTDYVDVYPLASPWTGFSNLAFQTGSGAIGGLPDGALGAMIGGFLNENAYAAVGFADANADAADPLAGFDMLFDDFETFKSIEIGWTSGADRLFVDNTHLTFWQIDARDEADTSEGHGVAVSVTRGIDETWMPFLRGGWTDGGGSLYEMSLSTGFGFSREPGRDLLGLGVNWNRPNPETFGRGLDDQITLEAFQYWQVAKGVAVTPSLQLIRNPALYPDRDFVALFGLRLRAAF